MPEITVEGGVALRGTVRVGGAKNAALKHMAAALLAPGRHLLTNVPQIADVALMGEVLSHMGCHLRWEGDSLAIVVADELRPEASLDLVRKMRASIVVLGPLLARCHQAKVALPGGDDLGARPIDMHIEGLRRMGAGFQLVHGILEAKAPRGLTGAEIELSFPSVGATENLMLAAALADGSTTIVNAAREPEIVDLAEHLAGMGAGVAGAGSAIIHVEGQPHLRPCEHRIISDRVEAGTYAIAGAITAGDVTITGCQPGFLRMELRKLEEAGVEVERGEGWLRVIGPPRPQAVDFATLPYPGFHTDLHPQMVALLAVAEGTSVVTENLYDSRFRYVGELARMGADITTEWQHAVVRGVKELSGCPVLAPDIRAGAALVLAGLRAEGETLIGDAYHIDRGYEDLVGKLSSLGATIGRRDT
ncbi:MAG TPA: UDP-N-acetylglucosamine 1-carboxyvinyltransferase [Acidimicrobiia bacterium]|nr:UDP-N-acetylglucosamine 1-carboxyvinyltransferase [Acidimicrobiia bacterium]